VRGPHAVDDHVVQEGALGRQQSRILGLADGKLCRVVARDLLHGGEGGFAGNLDLAHVADIEDACPRPHGHVFAGDPGVLDGHVPTGERHHAPLRGTVTGVERCFAELGAGRIGH
jgi:hypothetical protein